MKSKSTLKKTFIGLLTSSILIIGCKNEVQTKIPSKKKVFNGLYTVKYKDYEMQYVWIFAEDTYYILYPGTNSQYLNPNTQIQYETPLHYYINDNKFYSCGIENTGKATPLEQCKKGEYDPRYNIISIDTIEEYSNYKYQVIVLDDYHAKPSQKIVLKKSI